MATKTCLDIFNEKTEVLQDFNKIFRSFVEDRLKEGQVINPVNTNLLQETIEQITKSVSDNIKDIKKMGLDEAGLKAQIDTLLDSQFTELNDVIHQYNVTNQALDDIYKNAGGEKMTERAFKNAIIHKFEQLALLEKTEVNRLNGEFEDILANLEQSGHSFTEDTIKQAKEIVVAAAMGKNDVLDKWAKDNGYKGLAEFEDELNLSIATGKTGKNPVVQAVAAWFDRYDKASTRIVRENNPNATALEGHTQSTSPNADKIVVAGVEDYINDIEDLLDVDAMVKNTKWDTQGLDEFDADTMRREFLKELYVVDSQRPDLGLGKAPARTDSYLASRKKVFKDPQSELEYIRLYGHSDRGLLGNIIYHRMNRVRQAAGYQLFGAKPGHVYRSINNLIDSGKGDLAEPTGTKTKTSEGKTARDNVRGTLKNFISRVEARRGVGESGDDMLKTLGDMASSLVTAGLTQGSPIRDIAMDKTFYAAWQKGVMQGKSPVVSMFDAIGELGALAKEVGSIGEPTLNAQVTEELAKTLGITTKMNYRALYANIEDDLNNYSGSKQSKAEKRAMKGAKVAGQVTDALSTLSLATRIQNGSRVKDIPWAGDTVSRVFDSQWDELEINFRGLLEDHGFTKAEFDLLKQTNTKTLTVDGETARLGLDTDKFDLIPDSELQKVSRGAETPAAIRQRLKSRYKLFSNDLVNIINTLPSQAGDLFGRTGNAKVDAYISQMSRFFNLTGTAWLNLMKQFHRANGGNVFDIGHFSFGTIAKQMGKTNAGIYRGAALLGVMATGGLGYIWLKDLRDGKTPRDITPALLADALITAGIGGAAGYFYESIKYNGALFGLPIVGVGAKALKGVTGAAAGAIGLAEAEGEEAETEAKDKLYKGLKDAASSTGFGELWWGKLLRDVFINKALDVPISKKDRAYDFKLGRESWLSPEDESDLEARQLRRDERNRKIKEEGGIVDNFGRVIKKPIKNWFDE